MWRECRTALRASSMTDLSGHQALTAQVDRLLLDQGRLDPLELLLGLALLSYED